MAKRKRGDTEAAANKTTSSKKHATVADVNGDSKTTSGTPKVSNLSEPPLAATPAARGNHPVSIQIVTGSYERVLHGLTATISPETLTSADEDAPDGTTAFSDTFLFAAHSAAVRCLALSPHAEASKRILATGSSDERINLYTLSTRPPKASIKPDLPTLSGTKVMENKGNKELGSLLHHSRGVTKLQFPTKGKLFSSAEDNTVAISRTRDWTMLSSIKAPIPKPFGRPSGDTAAPGEVPAGVNDFGIHPSMKIMVTVGKGERSMRLWDLVKGKKAGVLQFERELLQQAGEGKYSSGEGRKIVWSEDGEDFVIGFERGAALFGMDCKPKAIITPSPRSKIHQMRFIPSESANILAISTEDGRIIFYDINNISEAEEGQTNGEAKSKSKPSASGSIPQCPPIAQMGGSAAGLPGRVKDFEILSVPGEPAAPMIFVAGSSDGAIRLWKLSVSDLTTSQSETDGTEEAAVESARQVGSLVGVHETGERITCLTAFVMDSPDSTDEDDEDDDDFAGFSDAGDGASDSDSE